MKLTKNFHLSEFTRSGAALRHGIDNTPNPDQLENIIRVARNVAQPVRDHFGQPVIISSGLRVPELNRIIGGASNSDHMRGEAIDFEVAGVHSRFVWLFIKENMEFNQLIGEYLEYEDPAAGWIHCSLKASGNKQQAASITRKYGWENELKFDD